MITASGVVLGMNVGLHLRLLPALADPRWFTFGSTAGLLIPLLLALILVLPQTRNEPHRVHHLPNPGLFSRLVPGVNDVMDELVRQPLWIFGLGRRPTRDSP